MTITQNDRAGTGRAGTPVTGTPLSGAPLSGAPLAGAPLAGTGRSISQVAELTGLSTHTLRYYEREGLMLTPVDRASSSHRRYGDADVGWVEFLTKLRRTAMPIAEVRRYVELVREGDFTTVERLELLRQHRLAVLEEIAGMTKSLAAIDFKIDLYETKLHESPWNEQKAETE